MNPPLLIRAARPSDVRAITSIYNHYITDTVVTFEMEEVTHEEMAERVRDVQSQSFPWLVAQQAGEIVGYAYAAKWHRRAAYRFSVESTVYLAPNRTGMGFGSQLYEQLLALLSGGDTHTVIGGIALPNDASVALHEKFGFRKAAHYRETGFKFGRWIDVGYWQRILR